MTLNSLNITMAFVFLFYHGMCIEVIICIVYTHILFKILFIIGTLVGEGR